MDNPYLALLPSVQSLSERALSLGSLPHLSPAERDLRPVDRRYALMRLFDYFDPAPRNLRLSEGIDMLIHQGYEHRNPSRNGHVKRALSVANRANIKQLLFSPMNDGTRSSLTGALIGAPGMGKSRTVERTLARYPQVIPHDRMPSQVTWLKLECPRRGSVRTLCTQLFTQIGSLLGNTNYVKLYGTGAASETDLQNMMALVSNLHGLGLLVIDEIQHIGRSADGEHELMTFLTSLSNQLGIPLLFIGTLSVLGRIEATGRLARRSVGPASAVWHPLTMDHEWRAHFDALWRYQWTSTATPISEELRTAFFESTGGILDLLVKLFLSVQMRLIYRSELRGNDDETITPSFVRSVAEVDFRPVKHIVKALVSGNEAEIRQFDDLHSFDGGFRAGLAQLADSNLAAQITSSDNTLRLAALAPLPTGDAYETISAKLSADGIGKDLIYRLVDAVRSQGHDAQKDLLGFYERVLKLKVKAKKMQKSTRHLDIANLEPSDLRRLVLESVELGVTPREAMREAGLVGIWPLAARPAS